MFSRFLVHWCSFQNCTLKWLPTSFNCSSISLFPWAFPSWVSPQILKSVLWSLSITTISVCCGQTHHIPLTFQVQLLGWCKCYWLSQTCAPFPLPRAPRLWCFIIDFSTVSNNQPFFEFQQVPKTSLLPNFPNLLFFSPIFFIIWQARIVMSPLLWSTEAEKLSLHGVMLCWAPAQSLSSDSKEESTLVVYLSAPAFLFGKNCFSKPAGV